MLGVVAHPGLAECGFHLAVIRYSRMSSSTGNWLIAAGAVALLLGLLIAARRHGQHVDTSLLTLGAADYLSAP